MDIDRLQQVNDKVWKGFPSLPGRVLLSYADRDNVDIVAPHGREDRVNDFLAIASNWDALYFDGSFEWYTEKEIDSLTIHINGFFYYGELSESVLFTAINKFGDARTLEVSRVADEPALKVGWD